MLARLSMGEATVSELASAHKISIPGISKHVRVLENAGLVHREKRGREYYCRIKPATMREAATWLVRLQHFREQQLDALDNFLVQDGANE